MYLLGDGAATEAALDLLSPSNARVVVGCAGLAGTLSLANSTTGLPFPFQLPYQLFLLASEASFKEPFGVFVVGFRVSFDTVEGRNDCEEDFEEGTSMGVGISGVTTGASRDFGGVVSNPGLLEDSDWEVVEGPAGGESFFLASSLGFDFLRGPMGIREVIRSMRSNRLFMVVRLVFIEVHMVQLELIYQAAVETWPDTRQHTET